MAWPTTKSIPEWGKRDTDPKTVGAVAGAGVFGATHIDLRPKVDIKKAPYLGETWESAKKHIKPGDILVGGTKTAPQAYVSELKDFRKIFKRARAQGKSIKDAVNIARKRVDIASLASKLGEPTLSHTAVFATPTKTAYGGGWYQHASEDIPLNRRALGIERRAHRTSHYVIMRPREGMSPLREIYRRQGARKAVAQAGRMAGEAKDYKTLGSIKETMLDWLTPKLRSTERIKSRALRAAEMCTPGGWCSVTGALGTEKTIGGKVGTKVLPKDYLRSHGFRVVGKIGKGHMTLAQKALFAAPRLAVRGVVAGAVGVGAYHTAKMFQKRNLTRSLKNQPFEIEKKSAYEEAYQAAFNDELEKISGCKSH